MNHRYTELLRHQIRAAFIDGLRHFTCLDEKSIDGTYRECIDEARAAIDLLECSIHSNDGEIIEPLDIETVKNVLAIILESLGPDTARSQRIRSLISELENIINNSNIAEDIENATFH